MPEDYDKLRDLLKKLFYNKTQLIEFLKQNNKAIKLNKNSTYKEIIASVGSQQLLDLLGVHSINEGFRKIEIDELLSRGLNRDEIRALAKKLNLSGNTKEECLHSIFKINENELLEAIKNLYQTNKISGIYQYKKITLGPLGILNGCCEREYDDDIIDVLYDYDQKDLRKIAELLKIEEINETKDFLVQKILTDFNNEKIILCIQQLISEKQIQIPKISEYSNLIITSCGIFERKEDVFHPKEKLKDFLLKEVPIGDLVSVISYELGINSDKATSEMESLLLEYCIKNPPESVIKKFFSSSGILKLAEKIFHQKPPKSTPEDEIINCILSVSGFDIPPKLVGLKTYQKTLTDNYDKIDITTDEVILIANETDKILRDMIEFYSKFLLDIKEEEDFKKIVTVKFNIEKHFSSLTTGVLIGILRNMNELIHKDQNMFDKFNHEFNRHYLMQDKTLKILDEWVQYRNIIVHGNTATKNIDETEIKQISKKLIEFSNDIQDNIYPLVVRMDKEETDKYGTHFVILKDERGNEYRILTSIYIDTSVYFMSPSNKTLRINPFIVKQQT